MIAASMKERIPAERELLLLCARARIDDVRASRIRALVEQGQDWAGVLVSAAEQGVGPVVWQRLEVHAGDSLPPLWRAQFREEFERNARRNLFLSGELIRVLNALTAGVPATSYKGPILAAQAYGNIALRKFTDLDIIVPQKEMPEVHRVLTSQSFASEISGGAEMDMSRRIPGQYAYRHQASGTHVEMHTEATLRYVPRRLDLTAMVARRETVSLGGIRVPTFCPEDALALLAVHGAKHFWDRLGWVADIAALDQTRGIDWELGFARANALGAGRMVLLAASLATMLLDAPLTDKMKARLQQEKVTRRMGEEICRRFLRSAPEHLGVVHRFIFRVRMRGAIAPGFLYAMGLAITPTETDREANPIANHFEPIHAIFRPIRLARLYGWRTRTAEAPAGLKCDMTADVAEQLLAFAEVSADNFVVDMLTGTGQLAILAARNWGATGVGIVADDRTAVEAKIVAREYNMLAQVRILQEDPREDAVVRVRAVLDEVPVRVSSEIPSQSGTGSDPRLVILFIDASRPSNSEFGRFVETATTCGVRVVSMGGEVAGLPPSREICVQQDRDRVAVLRLWNPIPRRALLPSETAGPSP